MLQIKNYSLEYVKGRKVIKGLNLGAEDYMTKPFSTKELLVRINKIILRKLLLHSLQSVQSTRTHFPLRNRVS